MEDLYVVGGEDPPSPRPTLPIPEDMRDDINLLYAAEYGKGLDDFFETDWFGTQGKQCLGDDASKMEMFASMLDVFEMKDNYDMTRKMPAVEARMVWNLMGMPREHARRQSGQPDQELERVLNRLTIFEHLMTSQNLAANPLANVGVSADSRYKEMQFWVYLGEFVKNHTAPAEAMRPSSSHQTSPAEVPLKQMRMLLEGRENRDVLYSMALVRHIGFRIPGFPPIDVNRLPSNLPQPEREKLTFAARFLEDEMSEKGMTQVVRRLCGMAKRSWALSR